MCYYRRLVDIIWIFRDNFKLFSFSLGFFFTNIPNSPDSKGNGSYFLNSSLPPPPIFANISIIAVWTLQNTSPDIIVLVIHIHLAPGIKISKSCFTDNVWTIDVCLKDSLFNCREAVAHGWSVKKVFLEISQNSQGNTCTSGLQPY